VFIVKLYMVALRTLPARIILDAEIEKSGPGRFVARRSRAEETRMAGILRNWSEAQAEGTRPAGILRSWWEAQKQRANHGEFAQSCLRLTITVLVAFAYFPWVDWGPHTWWVYSFYLGFIPYALATFAWTYCTKTSPRFLRYLTPILDMAVPTVLLGVTGDRGAIMLFVYTWITLGHGFRFGVTELYYAWGVALLNFVVVYALSAADRGFWYQHPLLWTGAFIWLLFPTFYIVYLIKQVAARIAKEARVQIERAQAVAERAEAERARAEAEAASEAKSEFLATMSHEMRTPLNGVVGAAELLAGKDLPQKERQLVDWLLMSSRQLRSLIDNLLDLRKIEAGKMVIERAPFDLHALMNHLAALFEPEAKRTHLNFIKSVSADAPYLLVGDDVRIQQVLINLVANALKFTKRGFVRVSVGVLEHSDEEVNLRFEVRDTGIGIPPEHAGRIFERFTQADPGIHRQYGGSGLGTTICKHLVEMMGGTIGFESRPEKGTTFWFTVRLSRQPAEAYEAGVGASIRDARLFLVSGRPAASEWLARAAAEKELRCASFATLEDALAVACDNSDREVCALLIDGEDPDLLWREVPDVPCSKGLPLPCVLVHPGADETEAFDAGYVSLLRSSDSRRLGRAIRSVVAGSTSRQPLEDSPEREMPARKGLHVLVAEDNLISQQIIAMMLRAGGHHVTVVSDGEGALENCRNASFDVVILDMHMPGRTGLEVAQELRLTETMEASRRTPIIMLTAAASTDLREDSIGAGADLFLSKPVDPRVLLRGVNQVFSGTVRAAPAPAAPSPGEYVNRVLLRDMAELAGDSGLIRKLTHRFAKDAAQLVDEMKNALSRRDGRQFRDSAHALKGAAMMAGAIRLQESAARIEILAAADFDGVSADMVEGLRGTLEATNEALLRSVS
jgi:two-component system sensor histidine kinase RpfC